MTRRAGSVLLASLLMLASGATVLTSVASANPLANPSSNASPSDAFFSACYGMTTSKADNDTCDTAALKDFDAVRKSEGLGPMYLPADFDTLSVPSQLLAISDIERVDRGLRPILGLTAKINALAKTGADGDNDPPFPGKPFPGTSGSGNWAGAGNSALLVDFYWMYDDGYDKGGSFNADCTSASNTDCWNHRDDILSDYDSSAVMGAAVTYGTTEGTSIATEYIGGYTKLSSDPVLSPTWKTIAATLPKDSTVSHSSLSAHVDTNQTATRSLTVTAPEIAVTVSSKVTSGGGSWSVTPRSCPVPAHDSCVLHVHFDPSSTGEHDGVLTLTDSRGVHRIALVGHQTPPLVTATFSHRQIESGSAVTVKALVRTGKGHRPIKGQRLALQRHGGGQWRFLTYHSAAATGHTTFTVHPTSSASYRLVALAAGGRVEQHSPAVQVTVS